MSDKICRICRQDGFGHLEHIDGIRDGLQISVLMMVICPIKIKANDPYPYPKLICKDCLEVVLSAHQLRHESLESEMFFRNQLKDGQEDEEESNWFEESDHGEKEFSIKQEIECFAEPLAFEHPTESTASTSKRSKTSKPTLDHGCDYTVELHKKNLRSNAWNYFGRLVDKHGPVKSERNFLFCRLCVAEKKMSRYRSENISTGLIFHHLKTAHEFVAERFDSSDPKPIVQTKSKPIPTGLTFACDEPDCNQRFKIKICLEIHKGLEHTGIADELPTCTEYKVDLSDKINKNSMVWKYFGTLTDANGEVLDVKHYFCRLCVNVGNRNAKYLRSSSTSTLLYHIREQHLDPKAKRKRFGELMSPESEAKCPKQDEDDENSQ